MKSLAILALGFCALATDATAQSWQPPSPNERCPSKWGAADERGSGNHMKPANVLRAAQLIKTGETFELGHVLGREMPLNPGRQYDVHTKRSTGPFGSNQRYSNEELVVAEIGQVGTQFDGFTHQALDRLLYNCVKMDEVASRSGFTKMGMEKVGTLMTRGVLIDIAGLKGVETLPINYEITVADLEQALQKQGIRLEPGDAVLIYTGWSKHWGVDNKLYTSGCPGIGVAAAQKRAASSTSAVLQSINTAHRREWCMNASLARRGSATNAGHRSYIAPPPQQKPTVTTRSARSPSRSTSWRVRQVRHRRGPRR